MRSQVGRDEQTLTIATTLGVFVLVVLLGVLLLLLLEGVADPSARAEQAVLVGVVATAVVISGRYLVRHRRS